jgi:hypothetical protein
MITIIVVVNMKVEKLRGNPLKLQVRWKKIGLPFLALPPTP